MEYSRFEKEAKKHLGCYVYKLIDPRNGHIFYIGKGTGDRVFDHLEEPKKITAESGEDELALKSGVINQIHLQNERVGIVIHRHGMTDTEAYAVEAALIDSTPGLTNLVAGHGSNEYGPSSVQVLNSRYSVKEFSPNSDHSLLLINISRSIADADVTSIYEAVRYAWSVSVTNAEKCDYILAVSDGIVRGVFVANEWLPAERENFPGREPVPGRYGFVGKEAESAIHSRYMGKRLPENWKRKKGSSNPLRYSQNIS